MLKGIIGDKIGSVYEGLQWITKEQDLFSVNANVISVINKEIRKRDIQLATDDTICTIGLYKAYIAKASGQEASKILSEYCKMHNDVGFGGSFEKWIKDPVPYNSYGNGSIMRLGFLDFVPKIERFEVAIDYTNISHNHKESLLAVKDYVKLLNNKADEKFIDFMIKERNVTKTVKDFHNEKRFEIKAQETLNQVLIVLKESKSFEDILKNCMYIGGDTDTMATIACNLSNYTIPDKFYKYGIDELIKLGEKDLIKLF